MPSGCDFPSHFFLFLVTAKCMKRVVYTSNWISFLPSFFGNTLIRSSSHHSVEILFLIYTDFRFTKYVSRRSPDHLMYQKDWHCVPFPFLKHFIPLDFRESTTPEFTVNHTGLFFSVLCALSFPFSKLKMLGHPRVSSGILFSSWSILTLGNLI